jgi:uncharacterized Zn-binding protein involved in type VI secretion
MTGVTRQGVDVAGGVLASGSKNVYVNGAPAVRLNDSVAGHGRSPHTAPVMIGSSGNVFVNGIGVVRAGDPASCGHSASGSGNVIAN